MSRLMISRTLALVLGLLAASPAFAQPQDPCPSPNPDGSCPIDASDLCKARVLEFETRIKELGDKLCTAGSAAATKTLEGKVAKEFGAIATDCGGALLLSDSTLTQSYLRSWVSGPSEGWGEDMKINGVKVGADLKAYRDTITSSYGDGLAKEKLPAWYKNEAAYAEALEALVAGARDYLKNGSSYALNNAEEKIGKFQTNAGLADTDARVKFLKDMLARIKTPTTDALPKELLETYAKNPAIRLDGAAGFYTQACDAKAAKDDSIADALSLAWAAHLTGNGPAGLEKMDSAVAAAKASMSNFSRAETAFGSEMTGAWMASYVKKTYFADDSNVKEASADMSRALADAVNGPLRARFGLPPLVNAEKAGEALGMAGTKFDSNDNLRLIFPGKCELVGVNNVKADGTTGDLVKENGWDARGIYDEHSYGTNKDFPISELAFREVAGVNKDKARSYDVTMKCGDRTRKFRVAIPPRPDTTEPINYVKRDTAPPYAAMLADGKLNGLMVGGHHTRDAEVQIKSLKELGFREVSRNEDVSIADRFFEKLKEKGPNGKPVIDYYVKDAHANGYAFDAGMFRANKRGIEVVLEKTGPDGKKHTMTVISNKAGEGKEGGPEGYETVSYSKYFDAVAARGDESLFVANFSCWSDGKSAFEWDGIRSEKVKYMPTDEAASYWEQYWRGMGTRENTFQIVAGIDKKMDYAKMRETFDNFDKEVLMPDDATFVEKMTDKIKSHRASSTGIPVRIGLEDTRPNS